MDNTRYSCQYWFSPITSPSPAKLRAFRLAGNNQQLDQLRITPVYLVRWQQPPNTQMQQRLSELLDAQIGEADQSQNRTSLLVTPRQGVQTPWSSKVLDIASLCGLFDLVDIESAHLWHFPSSNVRHTFTHSCVDTMTEMTHNHLPDINQFFSQPGAGCINNIDTDTTLDDYNKNQSLGLDQSDVDLVRRIFTELGRSPTDAELMMFAQVNSEHCRHRIFTGNWRVDNQPWPRSLFAAIKETSAVSPTGVLSAYSDNAAVVEGWQSEHLRADSAGHYHMAADTIHHCIKVETHNHPTAIAPFAGAATGTGGEIRDEGATGSGARPKAGIAGFIVGDLHLPGLVQNWEQKKPAPDHATPLKIMIDGPLGSSDYGNEFGRPGISGFFRTVDIEEKGTRYASLKPVMIAGGIGAIADRHVHKKPVSPGHLLVVLGGPSMRIGIGGGSTSSVVSGSSSREIDFSSVQRDNAEMERRCQQVLDTCTVMDHNPIAFIHDIGAGGLSNAFPELVHDSNCGAMIDLAAVPIADSSLSPMEIWCNESQERYALAVHPDDLQIFENICRRERCLWSVIGTTTQRQQLLVTHGKHSVVDMPMQSLFGDLAKYTLCYQSKTTIPDSAHIHVDLAHALRAILQCPSVASKEFLITIADRSITGLVAGEPMIGPWQVPVADCAVTATGFLDYHGEAFASGERAPIAIDNAPASARIAVGELLTNLVSCGDLIAERVKLSANWMAACQFESQRQALHQSVEAISRVCQQLGLAIPVGKDSLSMASRWQDQDGTEHLALSPLTVVVTGYCRVNDVRKRLTPQLIQQPSTTLWFVDLAGGKQRLGRSALTQTGAVTGGECPDMDDPNLLLRFVNFIRAALQHGIILAYHDRSDGGLWACLCEMAFAGHSGLDINISGLGNYPIAILGNEELGAVIQVADSDSVVLQELAHELAIYPIAQPTENNNISIQRDGTTLFSERLEILEQLWSLTSHHIENIRDNNLTSQEAYDRFDTRERSILYNRSSFGSEHLKPAIGLQEKPRIAILREQGSNGHNEMAAAFLEAGCQPVDVHMSDLIAGRHQLNNFQGLVAIGGFSYGDALGAGKGWASVIRYNEQLQESFKQFFQRNDTLSLGVCNGCQMLSQLADMIPGAENWPTFEPNISGRFEGRLSNLCIEESPSVLFKGMSGSILVTAIAHGQGRVEVEKDHPQVIARYVTGDGKRANHYPENPNGSSHAIAGLCSDDGRVTIMMPHPERMYLNHQSGWCTPKQASKWHSRYTPWFQMFVNARKFCDQSS